MFFSWESAMREIKRLRTAGIKANMVKKWYGWIVVEPNCDHDWLIGRIDSRWETCKKCHKQQFDGEPI